MLSQQFRRKFLDYFRDKEHAWVASSPVVPHDDPSLLFINAGMNQFKDVFLGQTSRDYTRAVSSQKCIRVGGKHNDLENVGHTSRHLTFFEMLGNFSFGDYFKKEAIRFAWEVSTEIFDFPVEQLWVTVFTDDDEAEELWKEYLPASRICCMGEKDNFWSMGEIGPCGPCSELHFDRGEAYGSARTPAEDPDGERFIEFWNLVFMQYNKDAAGQMQPLPKPSIDTGAGLERVVALKMGVESLFETDILRTIIASVENVSGKKYAASNSAQAPSFHVIADHLRTLSFAIADGVQPSNVDRGYVLRKVLRRAVRYGRSLGLNKPFLANVFPALIDAMGEDFPELHASQDRITEILTLEEEAFLRTLKRGGSLLNDILEEAKKSSRSIGGGDAFRLKDTYGFPIEEILLIAKDADLTVELEKFESLESEAREKSRAAHKSVRQEASQSLFKEYEKKHGSSIFLGYDDLSAEGRVMALVVDGEFVDVIAEGREAMVLLDKTAFYAEQGGQVGDTGALKNERGLLFEVEDTRSPYSGVIAHIGRLKSGKLAAGDTVLGKIDQRRRQLIANNHTATHILHWALQRVLGAHIKQAGSVVDPDRLRFDFAHHKAVTEEELHEIEDLVNDKVRSNDAVQTYEMRYEEAQKDTGIKQFFGDKYGNRVRVVDIDYSKELCGGTHTDESGKIGLFRIAKEGSIAAGVRRIEAVTGREAEKFVREQESLLYRSASVIAAQPSALVEKLQQLVEENKQLKQQVKRDKKQGQQQLVEELLGDLETVNGIPFISCEVALDAADLRTFTDMLMDKMCSGVVCLGVRSNGKCQLISKVSPDMVKKGIKANDIIKGIAPAVGGRGGGKADMAQAGGKDSSKLTEALRQTRVLLERSIQ
ncbi:alanine--tRNA ligase [Simkania negevensis]|uniref:Alanine--tRNA ligase n=1 Tax=Simkania negevensis TaxID=83561 RepID=A0ABS3AR84_9BACT|nr:alanine--tRNA ligase [Simkania negevensis]